MIRRSIAVLAAALTVAAVATVTAQARPANLTDPNDVVTTTAVALDSYWTAQFRALRRRYHGPVELVWYESEDDQTACGAAGSVVNSFYCRADRRIYLSFPLFSTLVVDDQADYAAAVILAHEWGHDIQDELGFFSIIDKYNLRMGKELQADCFAGMFTKYAARKGMLEAGDISEASSLLMQFGDDPTIVSSDPHGNSDQRLSWFMRGYLTGNIRVCVKALLVHS